MRVCIATRQDLFPAVHGAAVKIVRTAEGLSQHDGECYAVTTDREHYHSWIDGRHALRAYPQWLVSGTRIPPRIERWLRDRGHPDYWQAVESALRRLGYPQAEFLLYQSMVDPDFWLRTVYVGLRHRIGVFQAEFPGFVVPCAVAASLTRARSSLVEHNVEWQRLADTTELSPELIDRFRKIEVFLCKLVDDVIPVSAVDRDRLVEAGVGADKMTVLPHGVDVASFQLAGPSDLRQEAAVPDGVPLLFFHGTLHYEPNTVAVRMLAEEILPRLEERGVEVRVVAAGMNPPFQYWHKWLFFPGVVADLPAAIAASDLCVVPLLAGGGTRLKILEYLAAGIPTVSTRKGAEGLRVRDGVEMALVDDGDWDAFCDRVEALVDEPDTAAEMGRKAADFSRRFDWYEICGAYADLYRGVGRGGDYTEGIESLRPRRSLKTVAEWSSFVARNWGGVPVPEPPEDAPRQESEETATPTTPPRPRKAKPERPSRRTGGRGRRKTRSARGRPRRQTAGGSREVAEAPPTRPSVGDVEAALVSHLPCVPQWTKPRTAIVMLNRRCNLRCEFCDHWHHKDELPAAAVDALLQQAPEIGVKLLVLTGGEPFLRKDIFDIIDRARLQQLTVNITTNGTMLGQRIRLLTDHPPHSLSVSIDGVDDTHDKLRGRAGTARRAWRGIERVLAETDIVMNVYFVVTRENVAQLKEVYDRSRSMGAEFDFWPVNGHADMGITDDEGRRLYREAVEHILAHEPQRRQHAAFYEYGLDYLGGLRDPVRCLGLCEQFGIDQEGRVVPCCVWGIEDLAVGNIMETSLAELLTSPRADEVRRGIVAEGCVDRCFNHSLYEFEQATDMSFVVEKAEGEEGN